MDLMSYIASLLEGAGTDALNLFGGGNPLMAILQMLAVGGQAYTDQQQANFAQQFSQEQLNAMRAATNPAKLSSLINQMLIPLTATENAAIMGPVQASLAAKGLATSPGQMQVVSEQALAPYVQNEQQMAEHAVLQGLGLPLSVTPQWPSIQVGGFGGGGESDPFSAALAAGLDPFNAVTDPWNIELANAFFGGSLPKLFNSIE